jgi:hypothetical protein
VQSERIDAIQDAIERMICAFADCLIAQNKTAVVGDEIYSSRSKFVPSLMPGPGSTRETAYIKPPFPLIHPGQYEGPTL